MIIWYSIFNIISNVLELFSRESRGFILLHGKFPMRSNLDVGALHEHFPRKHNIWCEFWIFFPARIICVSSAWAFSRVNLIAKLPLCTDFFFVRTLIWLKYQSGLFPIEVLHNLCIAGWALSCEKSCRFAFIFVHLLCLLCGCFDS